MGDARVERRRWSREERAQTALFGSSHKTVKAPRGLGNGVGEGGVDRRKGRGDVVDVQQVPFLCVWKVEKNKERNNKGGKVGRGFRSKGGSIKRWPRVYMSIAAIDIVISDQPCLFWTRDGRPGSMITSWVIY